MERNEMLNKIYSSGREDGRLVRSRQGQLEYYVTMHYIHNYIPEGAKILEVGAGTGRYSIQLAKEGFDVTAVELVEKNLEILREHSKGISGIVSHQGDATDLSRFEDESFDAVLLFGPMYHLYEKEDCEKCLSEAVRVVKKSGLVMTAYLSLYGIMMTNYMVSRFGTGLKENYDENFKPLHFVEQAFTGYEIDELEDLYDHLPVERLALAGVDSMMEIAEQTERFNMTDEDFKALCSYQLYTAEKKELIGANSHLLHICRKK